MSHGGRRRVDFLMYNILITMMYILLAFMIVLNMFIYSHPSELQTVTGTVTDFKEHKVDWIDRLSNVISAICGGDSSQGSYLKIRFADDTYFEAEKRSYNYIDAALYSDFIVGDEITIVYASEGRNGKNRIYGIEYRGKTYLNAEEVLSDLDKKQKIAYIVCPILLAVVSATACGLYILNFKKNRRKVVKE